MFKWPLGSSVELMVPVSLHSSLGSTVIAVVPALIRSRGLKNRIRYGQTYSATCRQVYLPVQRFSGAKFRSSEEITACLEINSGGT
jgi:hypothetical protein